MEVKRFTGVKIGNLYIDQYFVIVCNVLVHWTCGKNMPIIGQFYSFPL